VGCRHMLETHTLLNDSKGKAHTLSGGLRNDGQRTSTLQPAAAGCMVGLLHAMRARAMPCPAGGGLARVRR
jgi:hypothetical protein